MLRVDRIGRRLARPALLHAAALAVVAAAFLGRLELSLAIGAALPPFILFYPAVMVVSLLAGVLPGITASAAAAAATLLWIYPADGSLQPQQILSLAIFLVVGVGMSLISELYRRGRAREEAYREVLSRRESEARFSTIFHASPMMMSITDAVDGRLIDVNDSLLARVGLERGQALGRKPSEVGLGTLGEVQRGGLREIGQTRTWESRVRTPAGVEGFLTSAQVIQVDDRPSLWTVYQDISERVRAEEGVRESEERFRSTLENMLEGFQLLDSDWRYRYINAAAERHNRRPREELLGNRYMDMWPGIESTGVFQVIRRCMEERVPQAMENEFTFPDGRRGWFDLRISPVKDGVVIFSDDISERKRSEEALRLSEEKFSRAFADNPAAIALTRLEDGRFLEVNDRWVQLMGYSREEAIGQSARDMGIWPRAEDAQRFVRSLELEGSLRGWEQEFRRRSGEKIATQLSAAKLAVRGEKVILSTLVDITERKRAERELRENQQLLQTVIDLVPHFIFAKDRDSRHLFVNRACAEANGLTTEGMVGLSDREIVADAGQQEGFMNDDRQVIDSGLAKENIEERLTDRHGRTRVLRTTKIPFFVPGRAQAALLGVAVDITDLKHAEEEIRALNAGLERRVQERTTELEAANRELESFAYSVSHDLRAPLRALNGFSQALLEDYGAQLKGDAGDYLDQIRQASSRMAELIDGMLRLSRATRGELRREDVDLSSLAVGILEGLARVEPGRRVRWTVEPAVRAAGDTRLVENVLQNLLGNAWKYTARAQSPEVRFFAEGRGGQRMFCVADNGAGFDMRHADRLFKPFQRLHRQEEFPGIGIGLATVQRIIQRHGGRLEAKGAPGQGAVFTFSLGGADEGTVAVSPAGARLAAAGAVAAGPAVSPDAEGNDE